MQLAKFSDSCGDRKAIKTKLFHKVEEHRQYSFSFTSFLITANIFNVPFLSLAISFIVTMSINETLNCQEIEMGKLLSVFSKKINHKLYFYLAHFKR